MATTRFLLKKKKSGWDEMLDLITYKKWVGSFLEITGGSMSK